MTYNLSRELVKIQAYMDVLELTYGSVRVGEAIDKIDELYEKNNKLTDELEKFKDAFRAIASYVPAGGYNSEHVDPEVYKRKIIWGINYIVVNSQQK